MASKGKAPAGALPTGPRMGKKGKKVVQTPPTRASARLAALKARTSQAPPPTSSTPAISQPAMKIPIFINLTKDSESEGKSKEENPERKLVNTLRKMIGLRELDRDDISLGFPSSTSSSSEEGDILRNDPDSGIIMILMTGEPQNQLLVLRQVAPVILHQTIRSASCSVHRGPCTILSVG
ncbi:hypothetical protein PIB30_091755 [Stylosanthes scabra]|uniref:Uncharacterized protein n=1 Tax=Stylosanthes scabra TaxID=79078 RepID=A0ABU6ZU16_9FABA|nr:hypothetical protein [Stylosanthes scabra]